MPVLHGEYEAEKAEVNTRVVQLRANEDEPHCIYAEKLIMAREVLIGIKDKCVNVALVFDITGEIPESFMSDGCVCTKRDEIVSLINYVIRCMLGHYSLDVDGFVFAKQGGKASEYLEVGVISKLPRETPRLRDSPPCGESYILYSTEGNSYPLLAQEILPNLLEEVPLEVSLASKEQFVGCGCLRIGVFDGFKLNGAEVVCNLREAIALGRRVTVDCGLLGEDILNCIMECFGNKGLAVIVVNLYFVELLQVIKMVEQEYGKITTNLLNDTSLSDRVVGQLVLFVREHGMLKRQVLEIDSERSEVLLPEFNAHVAICIVAVHKRGEVQGNVLEALSAQGCFVAFLMSLKHVVLFMEDEADEIVLGFGPWVAGLINKYGKLPHEAASFDTKNAEGKPPAFGSPPCKEDHLSYTTSRSAESIVCEPEHKFVTIEANTCSTYREAA